MIINELMVYVAVCLLVGVFLWRYEHFSPFMDTFSGSCDSQVPSVQIAC